MLSALDMEQDPYCIVGVAGENSCTSSDKDVSRGSCVFTTGAGANPNVAIDDAVLNVNNSFFIYDNAYPDVDMHIEYQYKIHIMAGVSHATACSIGTRGGCHHCALQCTRTLSTHSMSWQTRRRTSTQRQTGATPSRACTSRAQTSPITSQVSHSMNSTDTSSRTTCTTCMHSSCASTYTECSRFAHSDQEIDNKPNADHGIDSKEYIEGSRCHVEDKCIYPLHGSGASDAPRDRGSDDGDLNIAVSEGRRSGRRPRSKEAKWIPKQATIKWFDISGGDSTREITPEAMTERLLQLYASNSSTQKFPEEPGSGEAWHYSVPNNNKHNDEEAPGSGEAWHNRCPQEELCTHWHWQAGEAGDAWCESNRESTDRAYQQVAKLQERQFPAGHRPDREYTEYLKETDDNATWRRQTFVSEIRQDHNSEYQKRLACHNARRNTERRQARDSRRWHRDIHKDNEAVDTDVGHADLGRQHKGIDIVSDNNLTKEHVADNAEKAVYTHIGKFGSADDSVYNSVSTTTCTSSSTIFNTSPISTTCTHIQAPSITSSNGCIQVGAEDVSTTAPSSFLNDRAAFSTARPPGIEDSISNISCIIVSEEAFECDAVEMSNAAAQTECNAIVSRYTQHKIRNCNVDAQTVNSFAQINLSTQTETEIANVGIQIASKAHDHIGTQTSQSISEDCVVLKKSEFEVLIRQIEKLHGLLDAAHAKLADVVSVVGASPSIEKWTSWTEACGPLKMPNGLNEWGQERVNCATIVGCLRVAISI